jgi:hypothetical protein
VDKVNKGLTRGYRYKDKQAGGREGGNKCQTSYKSIAQVKNTRHHPPRPGTGIHGVN